jgi:hypothetical protein
VITIGESAEGNIVIRCVDTGTAVAIPADLETFRLFAEMVVDELNRMDSDVDYIIEEFDPA